MKYPRGFIDPRKNYFHKNILAGGHRKNAARIIEEKGWTKEWEEDKITCDEAPDFLVFRKGFIQIGSGNENVIIISRKLYSWDLNYTGVWKTIHKSLDLEQITSMHRLYKIMPINEPKF